MRFESEDYRAFSALFASLGKRACPIFGRSEKKGLSLIGTSVPVRGEKYAALLTASHVINELESDGIVIGGSERLLRFRPVTVKFVHRQPGITVDVDVAAIALPRVVAEELQEFYQFTGPGEVGDFDEYDPLTFYSFVGCPHTKNRVRRDGGQQEIKPYFYVVREYAELPIREDKVALTHVAFRAPLQSAIGSNGQRVPIPDPHGISGCGVWKIKLERETGRTLPPELVGLGIEYHAGQRLFVATAFPPAALALTELWKRLDLGIPESTVLELSAQVSC